jgi:hypothetical protein
MSRFLTSLVAVCLVAAACIASSLILKVVAPNEIRPETRKVRDFLDSWDRWIRAKDDRFVIRTGPGKYALRPDAAAIVAEFLERLDAESRLETKEKLHAYLLYFKANSERIVLIEGTEEEAYAPLRAFLIDVEAATTGKKCTVVISASKGTGAVVEYAKAVDARKGNFKHMGTTLVQTELEPANYVFVAKRGGKETGRTKEVDCTDVKRHITVDIPE